MERKCALAQHCSIQGRVQLKEVHILHGSCLPLCAIHKSDGPDEGMAEHRHKR
jgi:hypothetical protein